MRQGEHDSVSAALAGHLGRVIEEAGGWIGFERFMAEALYAPRLGYYARGDRQFGAFRSSGSDFITGPEMTPLFGRTLPAPNSHTSSTPQASIAGATWRASVRPNSGVISGPVMKSLPEEGNAPNWRSPRA